MTATRPAVPGATRSCPHCRTTILESADVCPACKHHLRFAGGPARRPAPATEALRVEGTVRHPPVGEVWEYAVTVSIRNAAGEEISRQLVGVGALAPDDVRSFVVSVEVSKPG